MQNLFPPCRICGQTEFELWQGYCHDCWHIGHMDAWTLGVTMTMLRRRIADYAARGVSVTTIGTMGRQLQWAESRLAAMEGTHGQGGTAVLRAG